VSNVVDLRLVNVERACIACGRLTFTSHRRIAVCAGCRANGLAGADEVEDEADRRAALVRMVVSEQWAAACSLADPLLYFVDGELTIEWPGARRFAALPCAVDVVAERLGER
jgi:hypothetical protein